MNAGKAVYGILSANSGVTDIVGTNIFPEIAEQETAVPFIVYQLQSVDPDDTHDGPSKLDEVRFEFLCYADSYNAAADLGVAVRAALDRVSGTYNGVHVESIQFNDVDVNIEYDPRRYSQVLTFTFRIKRDDVTIALGTPVTGAVLGDLSDVDVTGVTNGQLIAYNSTSGNWEAANDAGGANELSDLSDANVSLPSDGEVLIYSGGEFVNDNIAISNVTNLQSELDATPDSLDDLTDVKIVGTPQAGEALVYSSGFWQRGTAGASTLGDLTDVNTTGAGVGSLIQYNGASWDISAAELPSDAVYYHNRYASEAETLLDGATDTVELYYTAQADGDGLHEDAQTDTAQSGYDIRRKLYYAEKAQADPNTSGDWTQFADIADDTTYASAKATLLAYLKARTGGTVPISLKMTWEEVAEAPAFTGLLNESYGSGASAAYSVRRLNGNYTGSAIQVERSSDNTTQDIGFDSNGDLDESALSTFCSGTVCKVRSWYDQSQSGGTGSGNDAVQTDHSKQPTIYTGGAIVKENGMPAVEFDGSDDGLTLSSLTYGNGLSLISLYNQTSATRGRIWCDDITGQQGYWILFGEESSGDSQKVYINDGAGFDNWTHQTAPINQQNLLNVFFSSSQIVDSLNGTAQTQSVTGFSPPINLSGSSAGFAIGNSGNLTHATAMKGQEFILYTSDKSTDRTSIESNIGDYFTQNTPLLDTYTGAAAAYSLRKLRTAYSGSAIRVRRASDNAESDVNFNVFGELDTVSLASFCSGTNGFVKTWYDQSGNANDATQTTAANQPKIYDSSTGVVTENGKPIISSQANSFLPHAFSPSLDIKVFAACQCVPSVFSMFLGSSTSGQYVLSARDGSTSTPAASSATIEAIRKNGNSVTVTNADEGHDTFNSQSLLYMDVTSSITGTGRFGYQNTNWRMFSMQEVIIYPDTSTHTITDIEDNINTFYSIY